MTRLTPALALASFALLSAIGTSPARADITPRAQPGTADVHAEAARHHRSPGLATTLAVAPVVIGAGLLMYSAHDPDSTLGGIALTGGLTSLTFGPSVGHFYAGAVGIGVLTSGVRLGGLTLIAIDSLQDLCIFCEEQPENDHIEAYVGGALIVGATLYDILDAAPAARRHNAKYQIVPTVLRTDDGPVAGVAIGGAF